MPAPPGVSNSLSPRCAGRAAAFAASAIVLLAALNACSRASPPTRQAEPAVTSDSGPVTAPDSVFETPVPTDSRPLPGQNPEDLPRSNADILRTASFRDAMQDVVRIRLVSGFREVRYGLLHLELRTFDSSTPLEYYLGRLYIGYRESTGFRGESVLELWQEGRKVGEFTTDGLLLGPEYAKPR
jgi:hypothetical protein